MKEKPKNPTYLQMVHAAISEQNARKGASLYAIQNYVPSHFEFSYDKARVRKYTNTALRKGIEMKYFKPRENDVTPSLRGFFKLNKEIPFPGPIVETAAKKFTKATTEKSKSNKVRSVTGGRGTKNKESPGATKSKVSTKKSKSSSAPLTKITAPKNKTRATSTGASKTASTARTKLRKISSGASKAKIASTKEKPHKTSPGPSKLNVPITKKARKKSLAVSRSKIASTKRKVPSPGPSKLNDANIKRNSITRSTLKSKAPIKKKLPQKTVQNSKNSRAESSESAGSHGSTSVNTEQALEKIHKAREELKVKNWLERKKALATLRDPSKKTARMTFGSPHSSTFKASTSETAASTSETAAASTSETVVASTSETANTSRTSSEGYPKVFYQARKTFPPRYKCP